MGRTGLGWFGLGWAGIVRIGRDWGGVEWVGWVWFGIVNCNNNLFLPAYIYHFNLTSAFWAKW